ncbi:MAG: B12-binding domain-containing radical SAM protein [Bacillota bacterium]
MKRIALISPRGNIFGKNERMLDFLENNETMNSFRYLWTGPNLGLLTIASMLPDSWEKVYIDENYKELSIDINYDIVFVSSMTQQITNAYEIIKKYKRKGALTVIGGIHATIMTEEAAEIADVVIVGEGEMLIQAFLEDYENNEVKRIYRENNSGVYNFGKNIIPRYDLIKEYDYPIITIQTTRGCPHDCSFCCASKVFGSKYRRKKNDSIIYELEEIRKVHPGKLVLFADDNMFVLRRETKELLRRMKDMDIRWIAQTDISIADDDELLELMVVSGCQWIVIGFESLSFESLHNLDDKNWKLKQMPDYSRSIAKIQSFGIQIYGTFIVGLDDDDKTVFDITAEFIINSKLYGANITVPTPLPGTRLRKDVEREGRILRNDWSYYTFWDVNIQPAKMTVRELEDGLINTYSKISDKGLVAERMRFMRLIAKKKLDIMRRYNNREKLIYE